LPLPLFLLLGWEDKQLKVQRKTHAFYVAGATFRWLAWVGLLLLTYMRFWLCFWVTLFNLLECFLRPAIYT